MNRINYFFLICVFIFHSFNGASCQYDPFKHELAKGIFRKLMLHNDKLNFLLKRLEKAVTPNAQILVPQIINDLVVNSLETDNIEGNLMSSSGTPLMKLNSGVSYHIGSLQNKLSKVNATLTETRSKMRNLLRRDKPMFFNGSLHFVGDLDMSNMTVRDRIDVKTSTLEPNIDDVVFFGDKKSIIGHKIFTHPVSTPSIAADHFNGYLIEREVILTSYTKPIQITSPIKFRSLEVRGDVVSQGHLRGIELDNLVPLNQRNVVIESPIVFQNLLNVTRNLDVQSINGIHLESMKNKVLIKNRDQYLPHPVVIKSVRTPKIDGLETLNKRPFNQTFKRMAIIGKSSRIRGIVRIRSPLTYAGNLMTAKVNRYEVFRDFLTTDTAQFIRGRKWFNNAKFDSLLIHGNLNNHPFPGGYVSLSGDEIISSPIVFRDSLQIRGSVNVPKVSIGHRQRAIDLSSISHRVRRVNFNQKRFATSVTVKGNLVVKGRINGVNLLEVFKDSVHRMEKNVFVGGEKSFLNAAKIGNCVFKTVNNNFLSSFARIDAPQLISSPVVFNGPVDFDHLSKPLLHRADDIDRLFYRISLKNDGIIDNWIYFENMDIKNLQLVGPKNAIDSRRKVSRDDSFRSIDPKASPREVDSGWVNVKKIVTNGTEIFELTNSITKV